MVAMIGDKTLKKYFQRKYIHTYMEEMPRKVKKFLRKKFQTAKKKWKQTSSFLLNEYCDDWFSSRETKTKNKNTIPLWLLEPIIGEILSKKIFSKMHIFKLRVFEIVRGIFRFYSIAKLSPT